MTREITRCGTCVYWDREGQPSGWGLCRCYAPRDMGRGVVKSIDDLQVDKLVRSVSLPEQLREPLREWWREEKKTVIEQSFTIVTRAMWPSTAVGDGCGEGSPRRAE